MGLDKVIATIRAEGKAEADALVAQAKKEAVAILADAKRQAEEHRASRSTAAKAAAEALLRREVANAELEARRLRLTAERELMTTIRADVEKRLAALPAKTREAHLETLVQTANVEGGRVFVSEQDVPAAKRLGLEVAGTFQGLGGVVVEAPDGSTRENLRYETLLDEIWAGSLPEVAGKLLKA